MSRRPHGLQDVPGDTGGRRWSQESGQHSDKHQINTQTTRSLIQGNRAYSKYGKPGLRRHGLQKKER